MMIAQIILSASVLCNLWNTVYCVQNDPVLEALWNLTGYALQSRQNSAYDTTKFPSGGFLSRDQYNLSPSFHGSPEYAGHYQNFKQYHQANGQSISRTPYPQHGNLGFHPEYPHYPIGAGSYDNYGLLRPQIGYPQRPLRPNRPFGPNRDHIQNNGLFSFLPNREYLMEALDSISRNDELRCVPRILCEVTSGTLTSRQSGFKLPFNINMESIVGLLSSLPGVESNPLISFGKAAILGYSSKGNAGTCMYAYPQCPRDPEKLVEYLNNYNGGFFRFFNGLNYPTPSSTNSQFLNQRPFPFPNFHPGTGNYGVFNPYRGYNYRAHKVEKRILSKPSEFDYSSSIFPGNRQQKGIKFPDNIDEYNNELNPSHNFYIHNGGSLRTLKFPIREEDTYGRPLRKPKQLPDFYFNDETNFQMPLPNHRPTPMIFPDRTGTGELKFTPEELSGNYRRPFALKDNNLISFNSETNNDLFYYINSEPNSLKADTYDFNRLNHRFFPS